MSTLWKVYCKEEKYPGMWQRWFKNQCVGVGWPGSSGFKLTGETKGDQRWKRARKALQEIVIGDLIIVALRGHRVGRIGEVTGKAIGDGDWNPLVPKSKEQPKGEMGRRIYVRWDLTIGPDDREMVVQLPENDRMNPGELRPAICKIGSKSLNDLKKAMNNPENWIGLFTHFDYERALSGYIAAYPHRLEDGLLPHPDKKVREKVFSDATRLDVLLIDRNEVPVIVECKQHQPSRQDIEQLQGYMTRFREETGMKPRGILVHGGARKLNKEVQKARGLVPSIEIVQYRLEVDFAPCV